MAASPRFKVFSAPPIAEYRASCKDPTDAAAVVALYGHGASIRDGRDRGRVLWREGSEDQPAGESYDHVAEIVWQRFLATENQIGERD